MATKQQLIDWFSDGLAATGEKFAALINSLKGMQTAVSSPTTSGSAVAFIDSISQNEEGVITATKKSVSFSGYQTTAGMDGYQNYSCVERAFGYDITFTDHDSAGCFIFL